MVGSFSLSLFNYKNMCIALIKRAVAAFAALFFVLAVQAQGYYDPVNNLQGGEKLKNALHRLLREHKVISYGSGASSTWGAFYTTDVVVGTKNQVADMYSGTVRYFGAKGESVEGMNIEHSLPKSWWGASDVADEFNAYYDLHHLNPSDQDANQRKSNYPLAKLESVTWNNGVSFVGKATIDGKATNAFEPCDEYKGDFARTYMYMFTCYQDYQFRTTLMNYESSTYPTLKPWAVELLLKWHNQDPVSEKEIARNNAVFEVQGNRNPYIDYPQLAHYVWGDSVDYVFKLDGRLFPSGKEQGVYAKEYFSVGLGGFKSVETVGSFPWQCKKGYVEASAYDSSTDTNYAAESWLVSPIMDFSSAQRVAISFEYITKYNESGKVAENNQLLISDNYTGDVSAATWEIIDFSVSGSTNYASAFNVVDKLLVPSNYIGKSGVTIAFRYSSSGVKSATFRVKNLVVGEVSEGEGNVGGSGGNTDDDDTTGDGDDNVGNETPLVPGMYSLLFDASNISVGDSVIIVYETFAMGAHTDNYRESLDGVVVKDNTLQSCPAGTQVLVVEQGTKAGTFAFNAGGQYLAAVSSSSNYLRSLGSVTDAASWSVDIAADGAATIVSQGSYTRNILQYNTQSPRFSCYKGTQKMVNIYVKKVGGETSAPIIFAGDNETVDVYNLYGVCVKKGAEASAPLQNLPAGMYIINNRKVFKRN